MIRGMDAPRMLELLSRYDHLRLLAPRTTISRARAGRSHHLDHSRPEPRPHSWASRCWGSATRSIGTRRWRLRSMNLRLRPCWRRPWQLPGTTDFERLRVTSQPCGRAAFGELYVDSRRTSAPLPGPCHGDEETGSC